MEETINSSNKIQNVFDINDFEELYSIACNAYGGDRYISYIPKEFLTIEKLKNFILSRMEEEDTKLYLKSMPYHFVIEPTNMCNLKCELCSTGLGNNSRRKGNIDKDKYFKLIDSIKNYAIEIYLQNWGEPTIYRSLPEIVEYSRKNGIWTNISTNFSFAVSDEYLKNLILAQPSVLHIDLDGVTQEVYEKYRKRGNLEIVLENTRKVVKLKKDYNLKYPEIETTLLAMKHNEHQIEEFELLSKELGVDKYNVGRIQVNPSSTSSWDWLPENEKYKYDMYKQGSQERKINACHWPWSGLVVNWDGYVSACCIVDDAKADFGNIFDKSISEFWNNDYFISSRSEFAKDKDIKINTICNYCKNNTQSKELRRYKESFSIMLPLDHQL